MRKSTSVVCGLIVCLVATRVAADSWTEVAPLPDPKWELGAAVGGDGRIYAIGGANQFMPQVNTVYAYDVAADQWTQVASMSEIRRHFGTAAGLDGLIYVFGGYASEFGGDRYSDTADVYDPLADAWAQLPTMNSIRYGVTGALGPDGRIYAIGGSLGSGGPTSVEAYDPNAGAWTYVASMSTEREEAAATLGPDNRSYVIGGTSPIRSVEAYTAD